MAGRSTEVDDEDVKESERLILALSKANVVLTTYQVEPHPEGAFAHRLHQGQGLRRQALS